MPCPSMNWNNLSHARDGKRKPAGGLAVPSLFLVPLGVRLSPPAAHIQNSSSRQPLESEETLVRQVVCRAEKTTMRVRGWRAHRLVCMQLAAWPWDQVLCLGGQVSGETRQLKSLFNRY